MFMERDDRVRDYIMPDRVIWTSGEDTCTDADRLLRTERTSQKLYKAPQISFNYNDTCTLKQGGGVLLDFGKEYHGGVQIFVQQVIPGKSGKQPSLHVRFGESAMEAMTPIGVKGACNDHSPRDIEVAVANLGCTETGNTAFRFVRFDSDYDGEIKIRMVRTVFLHRDIEYKGSFECSDELLNKIWSTGAYTVFLNTGEYVWDGVKRDRLVWIGDMHPETSTIQAIFGSDKAVKRSLDLIRDETPPTAWMNGIPSYSLWWIIIHHDWYMHGDDKEYLYQQISYLKPLIDNLATYINEDGTNTLGDKQGNMGYFIDWPSSTNPTAQRAGVHALMVHATKDAKRIFDEFSVSDYSEKCGQMLAKLAKVNPDNGGNKAAASLLALAGVTDARETNEKLLSKEPFKEVSTFLGYYVLKARATAGDIKGALDLARVFWGAMLKLGATTFWEDFNMDWVEGAKPIDSVLAEGEYDIHGDNGGYCYKGFRHSLCHGWASGPTAFLSEFVLGIKPAAPGCKKIKVEPMLGDLKWARGSYPTPYGNVYVSHKVTEDGTVKTEITKPDEIEIVK